MRAFAVLASLGALLVAGCSSEHAKKSPPPAPTSFTTDEPVTDDRDRIVYLRGRSEPHGAERVVVDVVARGAGPSVHGAAFRLSWDPVKLAFVEAHAGAVWSKQAVVLAKEGLPGELVVVWTEKGSSAGVDASGEAVLGSIDFKLKTGEGATLAFRPDRSTLRDREGAPMAVEWRGGRIAPR